MCVFNFDEATGSVSVMIVRTVTWGNRNYNVACGHPVDRIGQLLRNSVKTSYSSNGGQVDQRMLHYE